MKQGSSLITRFTTAAVLGFAALHAYADAKQDLIKRLPSLQKTELDELGAQIAQLPARQIGAQAQQMLGQIVPPEKRDATAQQISSELKKYVETATPGIQVIANKVALDALSPLIASKFSEEELKQLVSMLESPVIKKYQAVLPEMMQTLETRVLADARPQLSPKAQAMSDSISKIMDTASGGKLTQATAAQAKAAAAANKTATPKK